MSVTKYSKAILYIAMALAVVFTVLFFMGLDGTDGKTEQNIAAAGPYLTYTYILAGLSVALVLVFFVVNIFVNPANLKKALLGVGGVILIVGLSYMLSSDAPLDFSSKDLATVYNGDSSTLKWTDAGLFTTYILLGITIVGAVISSFTTFFKR